MSNNQQDNFWNQILALLPNPQDAPPVVYDALNDQLFVFFGQSNHRSVVELEILPRTHALLLNYPREHEDELAGLRIGPGIQVFVRSMYESHHSDALETYREKHNRDEILTTIASILLAIRQHHQPIGDGWQYLQRIDRKLAELPNLAIHVPL